MRRRRVLSRRANKRQFRRTAMRVHRRNLKRHVSRGGYQI